LASQLKKKPWYDTNTPKQTDRDSNSDSSDEDDFYEGSGSEGSAVGEGQYGKFLTSFRLSVCSNVAGSSPEDVNNFINIYNPSAPPLDRGVYSKSNRNKYKRQVEKGKSRGLHGGDYKEFELGTMLAGC
jgi:hypothetical protein